MIWKLRIYGEPRPYPGKEPRKGKGWMLKGQRKKSTDADKRRFAWLEEVRTIAQFNRPDRMIPLEETDGTDIAIKVGGCVYITKPKSATRKYPCSIRDGDNDNYWYVVHNALEGIVYENDCQIVDHTCQRKRWANVGPNENEDPGISIVVEVMQ